MEKLKRVLSWWLFPAALAISVAGSPRLLLASSQAEQVLLTRAQSLAQRGQLEIAIQTWQQVLLSDPNSKEALTGIAGAEMHLGRPKDAELYLDKLRSLGGSSAAIAQIEAMPHVQPPSQRLAEAQHLAQQGKYTDAMRVYHDLYGDHPPAGDAALSYYDTQAAIPAERSHAIDGLRDLAQRFPADPRYAMTLGRVLTYDSKTRPEGIAILSKYPNAAEARDALQRAETWNAAAPESSTPVRIGNPEQDSAYRALNSGRIDEAQRRFQALLAKNPNDRGALSGMGYVLMKQKDFSGAEDYLQRAQVAGATGLESSLALAQFWERMGKGAQELQNGESDAAIQDYRAATSMKPTNPDALEALAGALAQKGDAAEAADYFAQTVHNAPDRATAWRGLFLAQSQDGDAQAALATDDRMPAPMRARLSGDPEYLRALAEDDLALGHDAEYQRVVQQALSLPFPNQGRDLPLDKQIQYASLLMSVHRYQPAIELFRQVVAAAPENVDAWRLLISAEHQLQRDDEALATIGRMPQGVYNHIENDAGFLSLVGSIYQSRRDWTHAHSYLERAIAASKAPASSLELQLADVDLAMGQFQAASTIYRRETQDHPENPAAWRGLVSVLYQSGRNRDALDELGAIPEAARLRLEGDTGYLQLVASIEASTGQNRDALAAFDRIASAYAAQSQAEPVDVQIQSAWVLLRVGDDSRLYKVIANVAGSPGLSDEQRSNLNQLLAAWSIRRATAAAAAGHQTQSIAILETAARAIPGDTGVLNALAGVYLKAGEAKRAMAIYESLDMSNATSGQYQGAIGAAMAAGDIKHASAWLEAALDRFQSDPAILKMAADYEQLTGNSQKAVAYYKAALAAMGPASAAELFPRHGGAAGAVPSLDSPTRDLIDLLAPKNRGSQPAPSGDADQDQSPVKTSWLDPPAKPVATLGDFADSGYVPAAAAPNPHVAQNMVAVVNTQRILPIPLPPPEAESYDPGSAIPFESAGRSPAVPVEDPPPSAVQQTDSKAIDTNPAVELEDAVSKLARPDEDRPPQLKNIPPARAGLPEATVIPLATAPASIDEITGVQSSAPLLGVQPSQNGSLLPQTDSEQSSPLALPPLNGSASPEEQQKKTPREQIKEQLELIHGQSSPWLGGTAGIAYRSGQPGYDQLSAYSAETEESAMLGSGARITLVAGPVLLDAGTANSAATLRQGTLSATAIPATESASGMAGELQLHASHFAAAFGTTPRGFLVANYTGGLYIHPPAGHFTLTLARDPIEDTQLSYAGLRDQGSIGPFYQGNVWGGVVANSGELQIASGDAKSGWYLQGGGQYITGVHVPSNKRIDGDVGAYWAVWHGSEYGHLTVGVNFFGMHYAQNLRYFTYGQGGYFSPDAYVVAGVPFTFNGHYQQRLHYRFSGTVGFQAFNEESSQYFPLDPAIQAAQNNLSYPAMTTVSGNYNFDGEVSYAIRDHWYTGGYTSFNNTRDYASSKIGFFVRYLFHPQPASGDTGPTGLFPVTGYRPLNVP